MKLQSSGTIFSLVACTLAFAPVAHAGGDPADGSSAPQQPIDREVQPQ